MCSDQETYHLLCERAVTIQKGGGYSRGEKKGNIFFWWTNNWKTDVQFYQFDTIS